MKHLKRIRIWVAVLALSLFLSLGSQVSIAQQHHEQTGKTPASASPDKPAASPGMMQGMMMPQMMKMMQNMMPQMMQGMMKGMMQGMMQGMSQGMSQGMMMQGQRKKPMGPTGLMEAFHSWARRLLLQKEKIGLSPQQVAELQRAFAEHMKSAIRSQADLKALRIDLKMAFQGSSLDLQKVEGILKQIADLQVEMQMEGVKLYNRIMTGLTQQQQMNVRKLIGPPVPAPWGRMHPMTPKATPMGNKRPAHGSGAQGN